MDLFILKSYNNLNMELSITIYPNKFREESLK